MIIYEHRKEASNPDKVVTLILLACAALAVLGYITVMTIQALA